MIKASLKKPAHTQHAVKLISSAIAIAVLSACGGGGLATASGSSGTQAATASANIVTVNAGETFTITGQAITKTYKLKDMSWVATASGVSPPVTALGLHNVDCTAADKKDAAGPYSSESNWTCSVTGRAPSNIAGDVEYTFNLTSKDTFGNSYGSLVILKVKALTGASSNPSVAITAPDSVRAGTTVNLKCLGTNKDNLTPTIPFQYQWVLTGVDGVAINPTSLNAADTTFTVPAALNESPSKLMTAQCRVTDSANVTSVSTKPILVTANPAGATVANAGAAQTTDSGKTVILNGIKSTVYDATNTASNDRIYSRWTQISGESVVISSSESLAASFLSPLNSATKSQSLSFMLTTSTSADFQAGVSTSVTTVAVNPQNVVVPVLKITPSSQRTTPGSVVSIKLDNSVAAPGKYFYKWTQVSGPVITFGGQNTDTIGFTVPRDFAIPSMIVLRGTASTTQDVSLDPFASSSDATVQIDASTTSGIPTILSVKAAPNVSIVGAGTVFNMFATSNAKVDDPSIFYAWVQKSGTPVNIGGQTTNQASFITPTLTAASQLTFSVFASFLPISTANIGAESSDVIVNVQASGLGATPENNLVITVTPPSQSVQGLTAVTMVALTNAKATDPTVYYKWTQKIGPQVLDLGSVNSSTGGFVAPTVVSPETYVFNVVISYSPITAINPGVSSSDLVVVVTPKP